jgi:hypothetical protein
MALVTTIKMKFAQVWIDFFLTFANLLMLNFIELFFYLVNPLLSRRKV